MDPQLLSYYEAIERASAEMLAAARAGRWDDVVKLEGACVLLISQLKNEALRHEFAYVVDDQIGTSPRAMPPPRNAGAQTQEAARAKTHIMQRILVNDAEIRQLAEPWLQDLDETLAGRRQLMH
jgi:flagellar protein FliT